MKPIPQFWQKEYGDGRSPQGDAMDLEIWGWSVHSAAEAKQVAADRLAVVQQQLAGGAILHDWYYERMPLREQILIELDIELDGGLGAGREIVAVITRNRYGAEIVNTDRVLIADIDLPEHALQNPPVQRQDVQGQEVQSQQHPAGRPADVAPRRKRGWRDYLGFTSGAPAEDGPNPQATSAAQPGRNSSYAGTAPAEVEALRTVRAVAQAHPQYGVHAYRTAAGLRVFVTGLDGGPTTPEAQRILRDLKSDPVYVRLCLAHESYRARLTPKPGRVGHVPYGGSWPHRTTNGERSSQRWVEEYQQRSAETAVCAALFSTGPEPDAAARAILDLHDGVTRATSGLRLA